MGHNLGQIQKWQDWFDDRIFVPIFFTATVEREESVEEEFLVIVETQVSIIKSSSRESARLHIVTFLT